MTVSARLITTTSPSRSGGRSKSRTAVALSWTASTPGRLAASRFTSAGFVGVFWHGGLDPGDGIRLAASLPGVEAVHDKATAVRLFDLPPDREGDVVVISRADTVIGASEADHDLSGLKGHRLRSHGGISEARVPFILSYPLSPEYAAGAAAGPLESHQIFDFAINGVEIR